MFEPLNLQTPQLVVGLGFVFAVAGAAILTHALWRKRRLEAWKAGEARRFEGMESRGERPDAPRDIKMETIAAIFSLVLGTVGIVYGMVGQEQQKSLLESNTTTKYPDIVQVEPVEWRGNQLTAEVTTTNGEAFIAKILFDPETGEPTLQGDYLQLAD